MKRRHAIKSLVTSLGAFWTLPTWANSWTPQSVALSSPFFNVIQEDLLIDIVSTIIPEGEKPGAKSLGVPSFIQKIVVDCFDKKAQEDFKTGLETIEKTAQQAYNQPFIMLTTSQKEGILKNEIPTDSGLRGLDLDVYISCREEQVPQYEGENVVADTFMDLGPYGAILSAFRENPNTAWLVVACDLPLLDKSTLENLIKNRNPSAVATTYRSPESAEGFPEPLITIWEPKSYPILMQFLAQGFSCPRKVLINSDTHIIDPSVPEALTNVNTPDEMKMVIGT